MGDARGISNGRGQASEFARMRGNIQRTEGAAGLIEHGESQPLVIGFRVIVKNVPDALRLPIPIHIFGDGS